MIAVPVGLSLAGMVAHPAARSYGLASTERSRLLPLVLGLMAVGRLLAPRPAAGQRRLRDEPGQPGLPRPGSPAQLAHLATWPTAVVAIVLGARRDCARESWRAASPSSAMDTMRAARAWARDRLGAARLLDRCRGAATDYPRFATLLLAPARDRRRRRGALADPLRSPRSTREIGALPSRSRQWSSRVVVLVRRFPLRSPCSASAGRPSFYQLRDADGADVRSPGSSRPLWRAAGAVLTDVREGKWVEGLTGREALFSQPVRYAFRPNEWQRSVDADAAAALDARP